MYLYTFMHKTKTKTFGPYATVEEAKGAFQFRYGYWPSEPINVSPY